MVKLFGFRITPFFLFIIGLEFLALIVSVYMGILLYNDSITISLSDNFIDRSFYTGVFLIILLSILTPGFFYQTKVINYAKKAMYEKAPGFIFAFISMVIILFTNNAGFNPKTLFIAALLSAFIGLVVNQMRLFSKYWRFMIRSGIN
ncbi:MAG: hypothetical protein AAF419_03435 [Pseudomonadota bacterium]